MTHRPQSSFPWFLLAPLAGVLVATACSGGGSGSPTFSGTCTTNADCSEGQSCVDMTCETTTGSDGGSSSHDSSSCPNVECGGTCCASGQTCESGVCTSACANVECGGTCCAAGQTCESGVCQGGCLESGSTTTCSSTAQCCQSGNTQPEGAACISNDNLCHAICTAASDCTSGCCATVQGESYGVCAAASDCEGQVGSSCSTNATCASGDCTGLWCTSSCSSTNAVCAGGYGTGGLANEYGQYNWCLLNNGGSDTCFPGCSSNTDCAPFSGTTCQAVTDVTGYSTHVCAE